MNTDLKIIISLAKIGEGNTKELKFVTSIVQYPYDIKIDDINKTSEFLYKNTKFFNKCKFIVINFDFNLETTDSILLDNDNVMILKHNIFIFFNLLIQNKFNSLLC